MGETWQDKNGLIQYAEEDMDVVDDYSQPKYTLYSQNIEIPDYAYDLGDNNYIWREILNIGDINTITCSVDITGLAGSTTLSGLSLNKDEKITKMSKDTVDIDMTIEKGE